MYFVNREKINETLTHMETMLSRLDQLEGDAFTIELAKQRLAVHLMEGVIDVGNSMIDGFIMRDPGSYEDIVDILLDERVLDAETAEATKALVGLRAHYVREFVTADSARFDVWVDRDKSTFEAFPEQVRRYLEVELGPVSAFLPESE
ncbi:MULTISPECIES: DUF86 domain-containing protein [unclassified Exiguobacterium]|jgi:uncharacterized protein YutE (UPF0331/DUF86 family)|uniref:DUF86 domain-containing protein n=1 Tax=Exiguobacterium TaxID=33986 RepID=UPI00103A7763|nr:MULTISPECIES: DUF86 domain-containing protein [unclassified Exiguobacterium]TCI68662.1 DUF86 domain-containing protein [Exiguobacterium sp. IPCI3]TCI78194.1 DUF86 domain-containing protein [Exiguobacterium sp. IPCH1]TCI79336.1 DUF86 domain-containing protein [Exiguobacterium sp. IPBC4]